MNKKQIVYVFSTNYAGSHFLALQLASHSKCASIGESHRILRTGKKLRLACSLCNDDEDCPLLRELRGLPHKEFHQYLFKNLEKMDPEVHTIIDNSKITTWAHKFVNLPGIRQKYIHLIRDPRALIRRWTLLYQTPIHKKKIRIKMSRRCRRHFWSIMTGSEANIYIWKWLYENRLITNFIKRYNLDARLVTYYDLVFNPDAILSGFMNWLGLEYEPEQRQYWKFEHHGTRKQIYFRAPENGKRIFDQRWKHFLDEESQYKAATHPAVLSYLSEIGLRIEDFGLTSDSSR